MMGLSEIRSANRQAMGHYHGNPYTARRLAADLLVAIDHAENQDWATHITEGWPNVLDKAEALRRHYGLDKADMGTKP